VSLAAQVIRWQAAHGRHHLPWQNTRDAYRVWLSEIMLQQTQVTTVLGYYERFVQRFPDVTALAAAPQEEVLALWSGLGYYSRARNLHRCAQQVVQQHGGVFPASVDALAALPGIGRSTAGAIGAFCFGLRAPILDANVRRVLTRVLGFDGDLAQSTHERALWAKAENLLPHDDLHANMPRYTQGLMDLGAQVCVPRNPACLLCPLQGRCAARRNGNPHDYPLRTRTLKRQVLAWWLLLHQDDHDRVWLVQRPPKGIWAGLYCPPVFAQQAALQAAVGVAWQWTETLPTITHVLTHRQLHLHPVRLRGALQTTVEGEGAWYAPQAWRAVGLPAPVRKLLEELTPSYNARP